MRFYHVKSHTTYYYQSLKMIMDFHNKLIRVIKANLCNISGISEGCTYLDHFIDFKCLNCRVLQEEIAISMV